jgi:hypothetical protein
VPEQGQALKDKRADVANGLKRDFVALMLGSAFPLQNKRLGDIDQYAFIKFHRQ